MKKLTLLFTLVFAMTFAIGQQVDRDKVVVELGTGTW